MANPNLLDLATLYANELAATSRAMLGLSSGGIGLLIGFFREPRGAVERWGVIVALVCFLFSILAWLSFSLYSVRFRQDLSRAAVEINDKARQEEVRKSEAKMLELFTWQQRGFFFGVVVAAVTVGIEIFKAA